ncbi:MAG: methyltransferase domain-containing protein [Planctomycetes bacterium]|nr:methyltransferase domain-containing protein [Planctomycetota bacterium]
MAGERPSASGRADPRTVEESWSSVAAGYREYWCPRLRPYLERAVELLRPLPHGPIAVPGCGPGEEVLLLAAKHPGRAIVATDPARGMLELLWAELRSRGLWHVLAAPGVAQDLSGSVLQAAAVLSCFTLQLLEDPRVALADWATCLRRGAAVTALFWPRPAPETPHGRLQAVIQRRTAEARPDWEPGALEALPSLGLRLVHDERVARTMEHASPEEYFERLVQAGPLQALLRRRGTGVIAQCRSDWLEDHGLVRKGGRWAHAPEARLWVLEATGEAHRPH